MCDGGLQREDMSGPILSIGPPVFCIAPPVLSGTSPVLYRAPAALCNASSVLHSKFHLLMIIIQRNIMKTKFSSATDAHEPVWEWVLLCSNAHDVLCVIIYCMLYRKFIHSFNSDIWDFCCANHKYIGRFYFDDRRNTKNNDLSA